MLVLLDQKSREGKATLTVKKPREMNWNRDWLLDGSSWIDYLLTRKLNDGDHQILTFLRDASSKTQIGMCFYSCHGIYLISNAK